MSFRKRNVQFGGLDQDTYYSAGTSSRRSKTPERQLRGHHVTWKDPIESGDMRETVHKPTEDSSSPTSVLESNDCRSPPLFSPVSCRSQPGTEVCEQLGSGSRNAIQSSSCKVPPTESASASSSSNTGVLAAITNAIVPPRDGQASESTGSQARHDANVSDVDENNQLNLPAEVLKTIDIQRERTIPIRQRAPHISSEEYSSMGSESELGSMSMEFDAVLAAAVAAGVRNHSAGNERPAWERLAGIEEESIIHGRSSNAQEIRTLSEADEGSRRDSDHAAAARAATNGRIDQEERVPRPEASILQTNSGSYSSSRRDLERENNTFQSGNGSRNAEHINNTSIHASSLTGRAESGRVPMGITDQDERGQCPESLALVAASSRSHSSSRRESQPESTTHQSSNGSRMGENNDETSVRSFGHESRRVAIPPTDSTGVANENALVERRAPTHTRAIVPWMGDPSLEQAPISSLGNSTGRERATQKQVRLARIRREKLLAKASAWKEAKTHKIDNRYKREESDIHAWEDHQKAKAEIKLKEVEMKLEEMRARALENMQNELAKAHKKAENKKAVAYAKRQERVAKVDEEVENIKRSGRIPRGCFPF